MHRRAFLIGVGGTLILSPAASSQGLTLHLGLLAPLSGEFTPLGETIREAAELGARESNVHLHVFDTRATPEGAREAVLAIHADSRINAALGPIGVAESMSAGATARRLNLPMISFCPDPLVETVQGGGVLLRWRHSPMEQAESLVAELATLKQPWETAGILYPQTPYGRDATRGFIRAWQGLGKKVSRIASYPIEKPDLRRALESLVGSRHYVGRKIDGLNVDRAGYISTGKRGVVDFDVLFMPDFHDRISRILGFLPLVGIQNGDGGKGRAVQLLGLGGWRGETMALSGAKGAGALIVDSFGGSAQGGRAEEFERLFEGELGRTPTTLEAEVFDAVWWTSRVAREGRQGLLGAAAKLGKVRGVSGEAQLLGGKLTRSMTLFRMDVEGRVVPV